MTDRERAIVMAYTGVVMLSGDKLDIFYQYVQEKLGRPIWTHEFIEQEETIKEMAKDDFLNLCAGKPYPKPEPERRQNGMTDRAKVTKWLECCGNYDENLNHVGCTEECPYFENELCCDPVAPFQDALELLREQPEIVRCKDCKHWPGNGALPYNAPYWLPCSKLLTEADWFCAYGERKKEDG